MARYTPHYVEEFPIDKLQRIPFPEQHVYDGIQTGGMKKDAFLALKDDIKKNGLINPIIVEVQSGHPARFIIAMGMNRTEAWRQLGHDTIKAVVITKDNRQLSDYVDNSKEIPTHTFQEFMADNHPGDELWKKSVWANRVLKSVLQA